LLSARGAPPPFTILLAAAVSDELAAAVIVDGSTDAAAAQVAGRSFMPLQFSRKPDGSKWTKEPVLQTRGSKFIKFQEARIQVR
jgi:hypothetical protein